MMRESAVFSTGMRSQKIKIIFSPELSTCSVLWCCCYFPSIFHVHFQLPMLLVVLVILGFKPYGFNVHSLRLLNNFPFFSKDCELFLWQMKLAELYALVNCQWYFSGGLCNIFPSVCVGVFDFMNHSSPETAACYLLFYCCYFFSVCISIFKYRCCLWSWLF